MRTRKIKKSAKIHDDILKYILSCSITFKKVSKDVYIDYIENQSIDFVNKNIEIQICEEPIHFTNNHVSDFLSRCYIDVECLVLGLKLKGLSIDAYGSILTNDGLLLNNYDAVFHETEFDKNGFCNVIGFATISDTNIVRFTQVVYSFKFKRLMVRDDVSYTIPFKTCLETDFGGKRATYRKGSILSIRTTKEIYKRTPKNYHQSDKYKNDLSYPRLILR